MSLHLILASAAPAAVLVTNFPPNSQSGAGYNVDGTFSAALVVTIGPTPIRFDSLETVFNSFCSTDCPYVVEGGIFADGGTAPGALLAPFIDQPLGPLTESVVTFTTAAGSILSAGTTYWFVLDAPGVVASGTEWIDGGEIYTDTPLASALGFSTKVGAGPWTPVSENDSTQSDGNPQAQLNGTPIPEPGTLALLAFGLTGVRLITRRRFAPFVSAAVRLGSAGRVRAAPRAARFRCALVPAALATGTRVPSITAHTAGRTVTIRQEPARFHFARRCGSCNRARPRAPSHLGQGTGDDPSRFRAIHRRSALIRMDYCFCGRKLSGIMWLTGQDGETIPLPANEPCGTLLAFIVTNTVTTFSHRVSMRPHLLLLRRFGSPGR